MLVRIRLNTTLATNRLVLSNLEYQQLSDLVFARIGIKMPKMGQTTMSARLRARLRIFGLTSFSSYLNHVTNPEHGAEELVQLTDKVTTNTTSFFRERHHFDFLNSTALPFLAKTHQAGVKRPLTAWSSACSSGEEAYTMAMVLSEFGRKKYPGSWKFQIYATDISHKMVQQAETAVYDAQDLEEIHADIKRRYFLKSKDPSRYQVKISADLRHTVNVGLLNLVSDPFAFTQPLDVIFCRNVLIYFDAPIKERIIKKFSRCLLPGGYLFIGNSESLNGMDVPFNLVGTTAYQRHT